MKTATQEKDAIVPVVIADQVILETIVSIQCNKTSKNKQDIGIFYYFI